MTDNEIESKFIQQFIVKNKRDRLLFELSGKKRQAGIGRFCHNADDLLLEEKIILSGQELFNDEIIKTAEKFNPSKQWYIIACDPTLDRKTCGLSEALELVDGQFYTDIYLREDNPHTLRELALRSEQLAAVLDFIPAFDRVETGYSSYREECNGTFARGLSDDLAVFWDTDEDGIVKALRTVIWVNDKSIDTARRVCTALGYLAPLLLADWNASVCVDLTDTAAIERYLQGQHIER